MPLEHWDAKRKKYVLYRSEEQHGLDCERFPFEQIPRRVFLDTNVINLLIKWRTHVFEQEPIPPEAEGGIALDVEALMHIFYVGSRADWDLVGSPGTLDELARTKHSELREDLLDYGIQIVEQYPEDEERKFSADFGRRLASSSLLSALPDMADRELIGHAIRLGCDVFCTCDRSTIVSKRTRLPKLPIRILTPPEWWAHVKPWGGLCG